MNCDVEGTGICRFLYIWTRIFYTWRFWFFRLSRHKQASHSYFLLPIYMCIFAISHFHMPYSGVGILITQLLNCIHLLAIVLNRRYMYVQYWNILYNFLFEWILCTLIWQLWPCLILLQMALIFCSSFAHCYHRGQMASMYLFKSTLHAEKSVIDMSLNYVVKGMTFQLSVD